jgi:hypothetical protein
METPDKEEMKKKLKTAIYLGIILFFSDILLVIYFRQTGAAYIYRVISVIGAIIILISVFRALNELNKWNKI